MPRKRNSIKKISPPFGYFGSKNKIALELCNFLPPHNCWVEAFCGSAALTLRKLPADIEIINDIDNQIYNLFEQLRDNHEALIRSVDLTPYAENELHVARIITPGLSNLEKARRFLVQSMMAINGVMGDEKSGFSFSDSYSRNGHEARVNRWNNLPERLIPVFSRLKDVRIEKKDARKLIEKFINRPATLLYLDPPYLGDRSMGYTTDANSEQFHSELLSLINKAKCMVFISGYENKLYEEALSEEKGWKKKKIQTITKDHQGKSHKRTEIVWMNKYFIHAQTTQSLNIKLTKKELLENKLNPERKSFKL